PRDGDWPRLAYDAAAHALRAAPAAGFVGAPQILVRGGETSLTFPADHAEAADVGGRSRARFRPRMSRALGGALPDSLPGRARLRDVWVAATPGGVTFELAVAPAATGWRLERDGARSPDGSAPGHVTLTFARGVAGLAEFAAEAAPGPRALRTVVLDPGHGGA